MSLDRRQFATGLAAIGGLAVLPGCLATNPATGRSSFTGVYSIDDDVALGKKENPRLVRSFGGAYDDRRLNDYVTEMGRHLAQGTEYRDLPYTFTVLNSPIVNAFALPGGYVSVSRGLIALASNEAELAGVISHELGHVNARHTAERLSQGMLAQVGLAVLGVATGNETVTQMGQVAATVWLQSYSRQQEFEADTLGVRYMSRAGYDPDAMVTFLDTLRDYSQLEARMLGLPAGTVDEFNMMSTHPRTIDRVRAAVKSAEARRPANPVLGRDRYLATIEGLMYGDDPEQGMVLGRRFVHPGLRFEFTVPDGFRLINGEKQVVAKHPRGAAIVFDIATSRNGRDMRAYLRNEWAANAALSNLETLNVNGLEAATGSLRVRRDDGGVVDVRPLALRRDSRSVFRLLFVTPAARTDGFSRALRETTYSFRRLSAAEAAEVKAMRLVVVRSAPSDTVERLAGTMPHGRFNDQAFRVLNDLKPGQPLAAGQDVKLVVF